MRASRIPPKLEAPKTTVGLPVGPRELLIVGPACVVAVALFFTGLPIFVRIGVAVALVGLSATAALARPGGRHTIEEYLLTRLGYRGRVRRKTKGAQGAGARTGRLESRRPPEAAPARAFFTIPHERVPGGQRLLVNTIGLTLLAAFLAWLWTGALADLLVVRASLLYRW